ncbi:MAG: hypothetical protein AAGD38_15305 [Acidobacteriota bacterium]
MKAILATDWPAAAVDAIKERLDPHFEDIRVLRLEPFDHRATLPAITTELHALTQRNDEVVAIGWVTSGVKKFYTALNEAIAAEALAVPVVMLSDRDIRHTETEQRVSVPIQWWDASQDVGADLVALVSA